MIMKKFFLLLAVLFFVPVTPHDLHVYNNTSNYLYYILGTKPNNSNAFPRLYSRGNYTEAYGPNLYFTMLTPMDYAVYTNSGGGFPFNATGALPTSATVTHWVRLLTATSTPVNTSNTLAQSMFGTSQRYAEFKFYVKDSSDDLVIGSGNIDPTNLDEPLQIPLGEDMITTYYPVFDDDTGELTDVFILLD